MAASSATEHLLLLGWLCRRRCFAEQVVERREQFLDAPIRDPVPERLALAPEGHEVLVAHFGEVLRESGLGEAALQGGS